MGYRFSGDFMQAASDLSRIKDYYSFILGWQVREPSNAGNLRLVLAVAGFTEQHWFAGIRHVCFATGPPVLLPSATGMSRVIFFDSATTDLRGRGSVETRSSPTSHASCCSTSPTVEDARESSSSRNLLRAPCLTPTPKYSTEFKSQSLRRARHTASFGHQVLPPEGSVRAESLLPCAVPRRAAVRRSTSLQFAHGTHDPPQEPRLRRRPTKAVSVRELCTFVEAQLAEDAVKADPTERVTLSDKVLKRLSEIMGHDPFDDDDELAGTRDVPVSAKSLTPSSGASSSRRAADSSMDLLLHARMIQTCAPSSLDRKPTFLKAAEICESLLVDDQRIQLSNRMPHAAVSGDSARSIP